MKITIEQNKDRYVAEFPDGLTIYEILDRIHSVLRLNNYFPTKSKNNKRLKCEYSQINESIEITDDYKKLKQIEDNLENKRLNNIKLAESGII